MNNHIDSQALAAFISENVEEYLRPYVMRLAERGILTANDIKVPPQPATAPKKTSPVPAGPRLASTFPGGLTAEFLATPRITRMLAAKADSLMQSELFPTSYEEDLREKLLQDLWENMSKYNPAIPNADPHKYAAVVVANCGKNILKHRRYEIANGLSRVSLDEMANDFDTIGDLIAEGDNGPMCGGGMPSVEHFELCDAIAHFLSTLRQEDQDICVLVLLEFNSVEIGKKLHRNDRKIRDIIKNRLARLAAAAGLGDFMGGAR